MTIEADLAEPAPRHGSARRPSELLGGVDVLVNNAGLMRQTPALEITVAEWDELFAVNLRAVFFLTQAVAARMAERGGGAVVSVASVNALRTEAPEAHYNATKAGIVSVMRSFATELGHRGRALQLRRAGRDRRAPRRPPATPTTTATGPGATSSGCRCAGSGPEEHGPGRLLPRLRRGLLRERADDRRRRRRAQPATGTTPRAARRCPSASPGSSLEPAMNQPLDDVDRRIIDQLQEEGRRPYTEIARSGRDLGGERAPAGRLADRARGDPDRRRDQPDRARDDPGVRLGPAQRRRARAARPSGSPRSPRSTTSPSAPARPTCSSAPSAATTSTCSRSSPARSARSPGWPRPTPR